MNGSGCKNCPVNHCETMNYRGSTCAAQRAKFGLGDPQTNADRIRAMSDEELAAFFVERDMILLRKALSVFESENLIPENAQDELLKDMLAALQQPAKEG